MEEKRIYRHGGQVVCGKCFRLKQHHARGFCKSCYSSWNSHQSAARIARSRRSRSKRLFGGLREKQLQTESFCRACGTSSDLLVHHIDQDRTHNAIENFATLCRGCHAMLHKLLKYLERFKHCHELLGPKRNSCQVHLSPRIRQDLN